MSEKGNRTTQTNEKYRQLLDFVLSKGTGRVCRGVEKGRNERTGTGKPKERLIDSGQKKGVSSGTHFHERIDL